MKSGTILSLTTVIGIVIQLSLPTIGSGILDRILC